MSSPPPPNIPPHSLPHSSAWIPPSVIETDDLRMSDSWSVYTFPNHPGGGRQPKKKNDQPTFIRAFAFTVDALINIEAMQPAEPRAPGCPH